MHDAQVLVPQQHQASMTPEQQHAYQVALQCATAAVESDAALDVERARYFYIKAANTLSALGVQHDRAASYVARANVLEQHLPQRVEPPAPTAPPASAPTAPPPYPNVPPTAPPTARQQQHGHAGAGGAGGAGAVAVDRGAPSAVAHTPAHIPQQHRNQQQQQQQAAQRAAAAAATASISAAAALTRRASANGAGAAVGSRGHAVGNRAEGMVRPRAAVGSSSAPVGSSSAPASLSSRPPAAAGRQKPKSQVHKTLKYYAFEQKAVREFRAGVAHCHDREHRHGKRMFVQSAESYELAIQHARSERPDVLALLQQGFEKALTMAEKLHTQLQPVYNPGAQKGAATSLGPIFSRPDPNQQRRRSAAQPAAAARGPSQQPARARPAAVAPAAARGGGGGAAAAAAGGGSSSSRITPSYWDRSIKYNQADFVLRKLAPNSQAFKDATLRFYETVDPHAYMIVSIELLQHPRKWASYNAQKEILDNALPRGSNEVQAFHGTRPEHVQTILAQGFLRDHNTHSAWGKGSYFARNAKFSVPTYCPEDQNGTSHVFLSRLLVGEPCLGGPGKVLPDRKPNGGGALHESMVDNISAPTIFVLGSGSDDHAYPELLLKIRKVN